MKLFRNSLCLTTSLLLTFSSVHAKEFLVGVELPLSGSYARAGKGNLEGITIAAEMFNKHNPKHKIKLVTIDDESSPAKAQAAVEKLAGQGVVAVTGGYSTTVTGAGATAANKAGLVYMTHGAPGKDILERGFKTFFRINNTEGYTTAISGLLGDMGVKSVSIVTSSLQATAEVANDVKKDMAAKGVKVTVHTFDPGTADFKSIINKIKLQDRSEAIFMSALENDYVGIIRAAKVLKPNIKALVGLWSLATPKMATDFPDLMINVFGTAMLPYPAEFKTQEGKEFVETCKRLYNKPPDYLAQLGYVQAQVLFEAIRLADEKGTLTKGGLPAELRKTNRDTLIGHVSFDKNGDNPNFQQWIGQHQAGGKIPLVWPKDRSNVNMKYPALPW